jgi:hypothetical protein
MLVKQQRNGCTASTSCVGCTSSTAAYSWLQQYCHAAATNPTTSTPMPHSVIYDRQSPTSVHTAIVSNTQDTYQVKLHGKSLYTGSVIKSEKEQTTAAILVNEKLQPARRLTSHYHSKSRPSTVVGGLLGLCAVHMQTQSTSEANPYQKHTSRQFIEAL